MPPDDLYHPPPANRFPIHVQLSLRSSRHGRPGPSIPELHLTLRATHAAPAEEGVQGLTFSTDRGDFAARYHIAASNPAETARAVVWVGGAGGGLDGPARGLYPEVCRRLQSLGVSGLRVDYRRPNDLVACVLDTMLAVRFLEQDGRGRVALVGHSFGGAVVITAGALLPNVTAVVPMSTQTYGTDLAPKIAPRPLLLIHGTDDEILPASCSERVYAVANEPKELKLFPGARHGLDSVRDELIDLLTSWLAAKT